MKKMKRPKPNIKAIMARLEKNKEKSKRREKASVADHPLMRVDGAGKYKFRAAIYPHTDNPSAEPFIIRHYHYRIPGAGTIWCPQKNAGEKCDLCDFVWERMKEAKGDKPRVKHWADKLPKARVWIAGKIRGREEEGPKFLTFGTGEDRMSKSHEALYEWFGNEDTEDWMSPEATATGGFDIEVTYEEYDEAKSAALNGAKFGFAGVELARRESEFGGDYEKFLAEIPNIDDNDLDILKAYSRKTSADATEALAAWYEKLDDKFVKNDKTSESKEADSGSAPAAAKDETSDEPKAPANSSDTRLKDKLSKLGL